MKRARVIDSHTGGEPTRVVIEGGPDLGKGSVAERLSRFRAQHDRFRSAIVNEPRGSDVLVGALLVSPTDETCATAVIFFNNIGFLGMCGHGMIGVVVTLAHLGRIGAGAHRIETAAGVLTTLLHKDGSVSVSNVPSWRKAHAIELNLPGAGKVSGDVAWGGNWFFLSGDHGQELTFDRVKALTAYALAARQAINVCGFPEVDHVELFGPSGGSSGANARNFVLCPGGAYDRSPCGTGTSAKLACLAADGELDEGATWVQESIVGSRFAAQFRWLDRARGEIIPTITGTAHLTAESTLFLDESDPFCWGIAPR
jgi:4-hydroxyproline epimerase